MVLEAKTKEDEVTPGKRVGSRFGVGDACYRLIIDSTQAGVEDKYFWIARYLGKLSPYGRNYYGDIGEVLKVKDIYTAGETSSYWGNVEVRRGAQIDKFQQIMANIGNMLKTLFQILRELRIIEERLGYYDKSYAGDEPSEVALKSMWVDLVEGGVKNPGSVTGLASQVGFVTLPDLFYTVHPNKIDDVKEEVEKLKEGAINRKVREVLARKLTQYMTWKEKTYKELRQRLDFQLKYLRQHYHVIKLYLNWLRPYLRNIKRLQMKETATDKDIVAAFETSKVELEIIARKFKGDVDRPLGDKEEIKFVRYFPCVRVRITFVAIPELAYSQDYQRGAVHRGRTVIEIEGFVATKDDIDNYLKKQDEDDIELLSSVDNAILAMKDELIYYLEKGGEPRKEEKKEKKLESPFKLITEGIKGMIGELKLKGEARPDPKEFNAAKGLAALDAYIVYKVYKQSHGMLTE